MPILFWPLILLVVAILFVFLELFLPSGGALSFFAAVSTIASVVVAFMNGGPVYGTSWLAVTVVVLPIAIALAVRWWPRTPFGRQIFNLPDDKEVAGEWLQLKTLVGKHGTAKSVMLPAGDIVIDGHTFDAVSEGMPIEAGQSIKVTLVEGNRIVVRPEAGPPVREKDQSDDILSRPIDSLGLDVFDEPLS